MCDITNTHVAKVISTGALFKFMVYDWHKYFIDTEACT